MTTKPASSSVKRKLSVKCVTKCAIVAETVSSASAWPVEISQNAGVRIASVGVKSRSFGRA